MLRISSTDGMLSKLGPQWLSLHLAGKRIVSVVAISNRYPGYLRGNDTLVFHTSDGKKLVIKAPAGTLKKVEITGGPAAGVCNKWFDPESRDPPNPPYGGCALELEIPVEREKVKNKIKL
jgi:hypothetical protein